jgi:hypothetical protein
VIVEVALLERASLGDGVVSQHPPQAECEEEDIVLRNGDVLWCGDGVDAPPTSGVSNCSSPLPGTWLIYPVRARVCVCVCVCVCVMCA